MNHIRQNGPIMATQKLTEFYGKVVDLIESQPVGAPNRKLKGKQATAGRKVPTDVAVLEPPTGEWKELCEALLDLFSGNQDYALGWLSTPIRALGRRSPIDFATTEEDGVTQIIDLIGRIEHGVYS
jgi:uncharacterized protein (DUF2384 family)